MDELSPLEQQINWETSKHIKNVQSYIFKIIAELLERAEKHDKSKLEYPEVEYFAKFTPLLISSTYGSEEYKKILENLKPALDHHYAVSSHHPEHHPQGLDGMTLIDIIELFADWKAATLRHKDGDIYRSIEINKNRFNMSPQLVNIFKNTIEYLGIGGNS